MSLWPLKQSTASQVIPLGPFVDSTDGNTAETGLTIANTDIKLQKFGSTALASKNSGGATHIATGDYYATVDATDSNTIGPMRVKVAVSGALPVWLDTFVYPAGVYDVLFGNSAVGTAQTGDVYDALTAAQSEPGQGAPAANASVLAKISYLFKWFRNKKTFDGTTEKLYNDDAATVDQKRTVSDDGSTLTKGEIATGP